jgi:lysophospholipase L1-like esterase
MPHAITPRTRRLLIVTSFVLLGVYAALTLATRGPLASLGIEALAVVGSWVLYAGRFVFTNPCVLAPEVAWFGMKDRWAYPNPGGTVFVGSSTIAHWASLDRAMAPFRVLNRGINGARLGQIVHYIDRLVLRYAPRVVVVYAGENDLAGVAGSRRDTPEQVVVAFCALCDAIHRVQPRVLICFVSIKPARRRSERAGAFRVANEGIRSACTTDPRLRFIDAVPALLDANQRSRDDVFEFDGIHLNERGYEALTAVVKPVVAELLQRETVGDD